MMMMMFTEYDSYELLAYLAVTRISDAVGCVHPGDTTK